MSSGKFSFVAIGILASALVLAAQEASSTLLPVTDNKQAPYIGVYEACIAPGIKRNDAYAAWLNRTTIWGQDTIPFGKGSTWNHISGTWEDWLFKPWADWVHAKPGRRMVIAIPLLPGPTDGSGPTEGPGAGQPVSLADGAAGKYNDYFKGLGETLVKYQLGDSILRLGWEWNGNWYAWKVVTAEDAKNFAAYWQQIVKSIRSVPGTENLKFDWNMADGVKLAYDGEEAYPGDDYVDYVGVDLYDSCWSTYPPPPGATEDDILALRKKAWAEFILPETFEGLIYWQKIADAHHKPMTFPEWGVMNRTDGHGGGDDPYFIQQAFNYMQDPSHNVYFASYFDCNAGSEGDSRISGVDGNPSPFPKSSALVKQLLSVPAVATSGTP